MAVSITRDFAIRPQKENKPVAASKIKQAATVIIKSTRNKAVPIFTVLCFFKTIAIITIVCDDPEPICDFIHEKLTRSATIFEGEGTYTHHKKYIILTVMKRGQAVQLRNYIRWNQPGAFMMITNSSEIIGKGFRGLD